MLETVVGIIGSVILSFAASYVFIIKKIDVFEVKIKRIERDIDNINSSKIEECLARIETRLDNIEKRLDK